jgi:chemosensory pili system protein ChpA (sensor histidine kinase/response regulator)
MLITAAPTDEIEPAGNDLGPLAWVLDELKKSLDGATKAMRRFVRDAELARGSDLAALDASQLRIARQQLHQAVGALEMVGFSAPAKVMRAMEALAQKFVQRPELCSDDAAGKMERASFALAEYLEGVLKGKKASPVALFPQYRDVIDMVGGERVHPADLWPIDWTWIDARIPVAAAPLTYDPAVRAQLDQSVLKLVKGGDAAAASSLRDLCLGLAASQATLEARVFWKICAAFFEANAKGLCLTDVYAKRGATRVLMQYATLARGDDSVSDRLTQDLLFFCAQACPQHESDAPVLAAVRAAYGLVRATPFNYETPQFGRFDPAVLVQVRKRIATATETWSALAGGDTNRLKVVSDQFGAVADSILKLHPESGELARALTRAVDLTVKSGEPPSTPVAMEIATAVLYLEAAYEDMDPTESQMAARSVRLAQRLDHVSAGGQPEPLESWMEDLYRRVSDRQTMGSVVDELRTTLGEAEKSLDQFFRNPKDKTPLHEVPSQLAQMRGVFSVLGLDQASTAMLRLRDSVEKLLVSDVVDGPATATSFEKLGNSIGAVGFLIDMLSYQRSMAKNLFIYDEADGEFKPVMGREKALAPTTATAPTAAPVPAPAVATTLAPATSALDYGTSPAHPVAVAIASAVATPAISTAASAPVPAAQDDDEAEIREIFLEEAGEVVQNGLRAVKALATDPSDLGEQTTLRRAFHTLKGSSRMVGLNEFGEAAWSMEQLLNSWLAEQKPASEALIALSSSAMNGFGKWVGHIAARTDNDWRARGFRQSADALRLENKVVALTYPGFGLLPVAVPLPTAAAAGTPVEPAEVDFGHIEFQNTEVFAASEYPQIEQQPEFQATSMFDMLAQVPEVGTGVAEKAEPQMAESSRMGLDDLDFGNTSLLPYPEFEPTGLLMPESFSSSVPPIDFLAGAGVEMPEAAQDSVKVIGSLRISIPLYNVFLNEADEWSRRLLTELSEWALELHQPVSDTAISLAHSLSGSSATVGFEALSDVARVLEQALQHIQLHRRGEPEHAKAFTDAAEDIRRLLHQFAAGFLKAPDLDVLNTLKIIVDTEFVGSRAGELEDLDFSHPVGDWSGSETPKPLTQEAGASPHWLPESVGSGHTGAALPAATLDIIAVPKILDAHDDDIDLIDSLDADLFPIFEEEATELMPQLGGALRQWAARPENLGARGEALRVLHTLKGSARLAGALRLGEMTHRMESAIEQLGTDHLATAQLEPLLTRLDDIQVNFNALRSVPEQVFTRPETLKEEMRSEGETAPGTIPAMLPSAGTPSAVGAPARMVPTAQALAPIRQQANQSVRVRSQMLDRLVNQAGEVMITRARLEARLDQMRGSMNDLTGNLDRLRHQLRDIEVQAESQMQSRMALAKESALQFDPLEFDRFTRVQELTRMMAESVNDVATIQRNLQRTVEGTEDDLIAQGRQARELQRDLLRTRMVEFEGIAERLYGVVRQAAKESGKQVKLDITGGSMDIDRSVLERMAPAFEHLLRNSVAHGIESPEARTQAGKPAVGAITIDLAHQSNELSVNFSDDGAGLDLDRIRDKAVASGVAKDAHSLSDDAAANLIFLPGFSTAATVTEIAGRGIGMDVVRSEMNALGGRIETTTERGKGTRFKLVLPLTTAVTQVVMLRLGDLLIGVPANLIEIVRRVPAAELEVAYTTSLFSYLGEQMPFYWAGALLQASSHSNEMITKNLPVAVFRSAGQRVAAHVDEVLGNQEVVVKNLGPQLSRLPGLTGMSVLASGAVVLIYNPVALASVYGDQARALRLTAVQAPGAGTSSQAGTAMPSMMAGVTQVPLIMVVDDSITVRRVTQRLLKREGYRVVMAADGLQALERLQDEKPTVVLSDIEMPRMDGFDLARNIRADANLKDLPIIMITSRIAEKHREHARELGVDHYLGKPYSEDELLRLVRNYCALAVEA